MPAGDVFGLDGFFLNKSNPVTVSVVDINLASSSAGIAITGGSFSSGTVTLNLSNAAGLTTTPFYTGTIIGVSSISQAGIAHTAYNGTFVVTGFAGTTTVSYATTGYVGSVTASIGATTIGYIQLLTDGNVTNTTWSTSQTHGWFGGGFTSGGPNQVATVDRIDFSNDSATASPRGPLSQARNALAATGNSNYGWFGGGSAPGPVRVSTVDRIDFSNDSATASPRGPLSLARANGLAATGNSNYGWFGGGYSSFLSSAVSIVDRIDLSNDSATASPRGSLSLARYNFAATGNSNYGWFGGGSAPARVDRIDFSNDSSTASVRGPLSSARYELAATGNSNYGWFGGGSPGSLSRVDRIDFSNDSATASVRGPLSSARYGLAATGNSNYGWFGGGGPALSSLATVDRIDFSNDSSTASPRGSLSSARSSLAATSGQAKGPAIKLQKAGNYGWFGGGFVFAPITNILTEVSSVDRIDFSNDSTTASVRGPLSRARYGMGATGNSNYGWFGGGYTTVKVSIVDRIDFSNDSSTASVRGPLSFVRYELASTGNSNYGWFSGGIPSSVSTVDRIDFSNDSSTASVRGPLSSERKEFSATGNSNYGWFGGGLLVGVPNIYSSFVDRIDFSNDSTTALLRSPLASPVRYGMGATGNSNYGWWGGGDPSPGSPSLLLSTVDRIDFSNDSAMATPRGLLTSPAGRKKIAATSNTHIG